MRLQRVSHPAISFRGLGRAPVVALRCWVLEAWTCSVGVRLVALVRDAEVVLVGPLCGYVAIVIFQVYIIDVRWLGTS